jgi:hypothetical protein
MTWKPALSIGIREVSIRELNKRKFLHGCASLSPFSAESPFFSYPRRKEGSRKPSFPNKNAYSGFPYHHPKVSPISVYNIGKGNFPLDNPLAQEYFLFALLVFLL